MYKLAKSFFFLFSPEKAHHMVMRSFSIVNKIPLLGWLIKQSMGVKRVKDLYDWQGITFQNKVGLAAGFDKDAKYLHALKALGFGFVEIGTVTPKSQPGNPQPRLFRLVKDEALINRMGFNNDGVDAAVERLKKRPPGLVVGGNIGKNKWTETDDAWKDYDICFQKLYPYVDYFVVNVSSPNTPNLRALQDKDHLFKILSVLMEYRAKQAILKPILLKIAPDLTDVLLDDVIATVKETGIAGIIATNTTISRADLNTSDIEIESIGAGGLSGKPVKQRSTEVVSYLSSKANGEFDVFGVGGIHHADDAIEKMNNGAKMVQLYTGFIYSGPGLVASCAKALKQ